MMKEIIKAILAFEKAQSPFPVIMMLSPESEAISEITIKIFFSSRPIVRHKKTIVA